jgi:hypothetical protein
MNVFMGVVLAVFGIYFLSSLFVSRFRHPWKGRTEPASRISHLGFGLTFFCFGFLFVIKDFSPVSAGILAIGGLFGMLLAAIGNFTDP